MNPLRTRSTLSTLALVALLASPASGQDLGREGQLSYGFGFEHDFDDGLEAFTDVALTLVTRTRSQSLEFQVGTELFGDYTDTGTDDIDFRNSFARAIYERSGSNSNLSFSASYSERNLKDEIVDSTLTDGGTETSTGFSGRIETGIEGPFGLTLDAAYRERTFTDTDLNDDTQMSVDGLARFSLNRSTDLRARAGYRFTDEGDDEGTERETTYVGLGVQTTTARGLSITGDVLFDQVETTTTTPPTDETQDGLGFEFLVNQAQPNGDLGASFSTRVDESGRRTRADVRRSFETKTGELEVSLGVVEQEGADDLELVGSLNYSIETPRSVFSAGLERDATTNDGETSVDTSLELAYRREINALSGWEASVGYIETDTIGGADDNRTTASFAYTRNITEDWSMRTGYRYSKDDDGDASNSVFFNVQRDITFGF